MALKRNRMLLEIVFCLLSRQLFPVKLKGAMSGLKEPISGQTVHSLDRSERAQLWHKWVIPALQEPFSWLTGPNSGLREPLQTKEWLSQAREGSFQTWKAHSRHQKSHSRPERFHSGPERARSNHERIQFVLEGPKMLRRSILDVRGTTAGLKQDSESLLSFTSCFGTTSWLSKSVSPARVQFSRPRYRTSLCRPLARGACCPQGRGYGSVGPPLSLATPLRTHYIQQLRENTWIIVILLWVTSFVTFIW